MPWGITRCSRCFISAWGRNCRTHGAELGQKCGRSICVAPCQGWYSCAGCHGCAPSPARQKAMSKYVVVWLDYTQAQTFHVHPERFDESTIWVKTHEVVRQPSAPHGVSALEQQKQFFADVASVLGGAE